MKTKKLIALLLSSAMLAAAAVPAFAAAPSAYDGQPYESVGCTSDDPDGEINLAVIANGKVDIVGDAMYIKGSVYSNDTVYVGNGGGNKVDGLFVSGVKGMWDYKTPGDGATEDQYRLGYIHVDDDHQMTTNAYSTTLQYEGAILDTETSFDYAYTPYEVPEIANTVDNQIANQWGPAPITVDKDTHFGTLELTGAGLIIDTTAGDVTIVVDNFNPGNSPEITVRGNNKVNLYINNSTIFGNFNVTIHNEDINMWSLPGLWDGQYNYKEPPSWQPKDPVQDFFDAFGATNVNLYIGKAGDEVVLNGGRMAANVYSNADTLKVGGTARIKGNIETGAKTVETDGAGTYIEGKVVAPNADTLVSGSSTILGQVITNTLTINGAGQIIYKADTAAAKSEVTPEPTPEVTPEPTVEPTPEPTLEPLPTGEPLELTGGYAYIFGYEPDKIQQIWVDDEEGGHTAWDIEVRMAPEDAVTREQVAAMIMRMIDQSYDTKDADYPLTPNMTQHAGAWYERGLAYLASKGTFDGVESVDIGPVTRGEVAKLVVCGLNLTETTETSFADIANSPYKQYIEIMNAYGYMHGDSETEFRPDEIMNRAEFCSMFNNIIGRNDMGLTAQDGSTVTAETYYFVDLPAGAWYTDIMLKATSAYDDEGLIDVDTRLSNIRNTLDHYDSQNIA